MHAYLGNTGARIPRPGRGWGGADRLAAFTIPLVAAALSLLASRFPAAAGVALAVPLAVVLIHRPRWATWLVLPLLPVFEILVVNRLINYILPLLVMGIFGTTLLWNRRPPRPLPGGLGWWFPLFIFWILVSATASDYPGRVLVQAVRYAWLGAFLTVMWNWWSSRGLRLSLMVIGIAVVPIAGFGVLQGTTGGGIDIESGAGSARLSSIYHNPNVLGLSCAVGMTIIASWYAGRSHRFSFAETVLAVGVVAALAVLGLGLAGSMSRASILFVAAAMVILFSVSRWWWIPLSVVAAGGVYLITAPLPLWLTGLLRLQSGASERDSMWSAALDMMRTHPWFGIGSGGGIFEIERSGYIDLAAERFLVHVRGGAAHNVFLTKGAELGVVGLVLVVVLFLLFWLAVPAALRQFRQGRWEYGCAAAGLAGFTARAFFESWGTLATGHVSDSVLFFLFGLTVLRARFPAPGASDLTSR